MTGQRGFRQPDNSEHAIKMMIDTPIARISAGRNHLIALDVEGQIYSYEDLHNPPKRINFMESWIIKSDPYSSSTEVGKVRKVVGGWDCSGALVYGHGLLIWKHDKRISGTNGIGEDGRLVQESLITPPILDPQEHQRTTILEREKEIIDFILIEGFVVFVTAGGRVYCIEERDGVPVLPPVFLPHFSVHEPTDEEILDLKGYRNKKADRISGFFKKFAVYNRNGLVHVGDTDLLRRAVQNNCRPEVPVPEKDEIRPLAIPSLNKFGTIAQIVFGDYHSHAVTQDGKLLSWGVESQNCGCLGIGDLREAERRGVVWHWQNGTLDEAAEVFFQDPPHPKSCYPPRGEDGNPQWDAIGRAVLSQRLENPD
jgi:SCF-associated factor 1